MTDSDTQGFIRYIIMLPSRRYKHPNKKTMLTFLICLLDTDFGLTNRPGLTDTQIQTRVCFIMKMKQAAALVVGGSFD